MVIGATSALPTDTGNHRLGNRGLGILVTTRLSPAKAIDASDNTAV